MGRRNIVRRKGASPSKPDVAYGPADPNRMAASTRDLLHCLETVNGDNVRVIFTAKDWDDLHFGHIRPLEAVEMESAGVRQSPVVGIRTREIDYDPHSVDPATIPDGDATHVDIVHGEVVDFDETPPPIAVDPAMMLALARTRRVFVAAETLLPKRLRQEEIGDALEMLSRPDVLHGPVWRVNVVTARTVFFLIVTLVRYLVSSIRGQKAGS